MSSPREDMRCETCLFWVKGGDGELKAHGRCHRFPAVYVGKPVDAAINTRWWRWPNTKPEDWCGEWQPNTRREEK